MERICFFAVLFFLPVSRAAVENGNCLLQKKSVRTRSHDDELKWGSTPEVTLCELQSNETALTQDDMSQALSLGGNFMLNQMHPSGDFVYLYDYKQGKETQDEDYGDMVNPVREACGLWGLSLMVLDNVFEGGEASQPLLTGLRKTLEFFAANSKTFNDGRRIVVYPGLEKGLGKTGTLAVWALGITDFLRTKLPTDAERQTHMEHLKGILISLKASVKSDGRVHRKYRHEDGQFFREHSPHFDGEVLLALVKAAKYLGFEEYWPTVKLMVDGGFKKNTEKGLQAHDDNDNMKGYYQWSGMSWYELLTSKKADEYSAYRDRMIDYALWLVNDHKLLDRTRNTGYAFEALIPAYSIAKESQRADAVSTLGCAIDRGMRRISGMQLGHPLATGMAKTALLSDQIRGGVQDAFKSAKLRVDTTAHQMHAAILARRLLAGQELI